MITTAMPTSEGRGKGSHRVPNMAPLMAQKTLCCRSESSIRVQAAWADLLSPLGSLAVSWGRGPLSGLRHLSTKTQRFDVTSKLGTLPPINYQLETHSLWLKNWQGWVLSTICLKIEFLNISRPSLIGSPNLMVEKEKCSHLFPAYLDGFVR
jgi:hypothetical protein